jgi:hypothetical protein
MGALVRLAELLLVILPLAGAIIAAVKAFTANPRRNVESADARAPDERSRRGVGGNPAARWALIRRVIEEHSRTDARWLDYELDPAALLDFPLMTDLRDPLTMDFHKAKLRADLLRPVKAEDLLDDREAADRYLTAVEEYVTAFNAVEAEAIRRRRNDFPHDAQQRISRAQTLLRVASDPAATPHERQRAYHRARHELDGLIVLPTVTQERIERGISGEIDR